MVPERIVLGYKISHQEIEEDKAKVETIEKLPPPTSIKVVRSFLGHAGFYKRFIKDLPFEVMCNASDHVVGQFWGREKTNIFN